MVFSFFKKMPEKMIARPAVDPRLKSEGEKVLPLSGAIPSIAPSMLPEPPIKEAPSLDFSDFVFSESSPDFQIEADINPIDAEAEEAAVLFANGQDETVRAVLENAVRIHHFGPGERLWLMLFDFYWLAGNRPAFEALGVEYAQSFEKSPPAWRDKLKTQPKTPGVVAGCLLFNGDLIGDNQPSFDAIAQALVKNPKLRLDLSNVRVLDVTGCDLLLKLLQQARKDKRELELLGREALGALLRERVVSGSAKNHECWLLYLELCQLQGQYELFEEVAVDYAVTFEVSPPSWESRRVALPESVSPSALVEVGSIPPSDSYVLRGEVKALRFSDLVAHAEVRDTVLIDCSDLVRMDFISAGALLNVLTSVRRSGKPIVFHHPNFLVAELFGVVGLNAVANIIFAK
ncbi:MAG: STAS domain-containing protein [Betaproteobacteria bacterium]